MISYTRLNFDLHCRAQPATATEINLLRRAANLAKTSAAPKRVAALFASRRGKIICQAVNQLKTHPKQKLWQEKQTVAKPPQPYLHAELACMVQLSLADMKKCTVYVARIGNSGLDRCSFPCHICWPALQFANVEKIVCFGADCQPVAILL